MQYTDFRSVDGKVAVVTGGANGIGQAIVELFAQNGMKVVIADISDEDGEKLVAKIKKEGGEVSYHHTDVSSEESISCALPSKPMASSMSSSTMPVSVPPYILSTNTTVRNSKRSQTSTTSVPS